MYNLNNFLAGVFAIVFINLASAFEYDITSLCKHPNQPLLYVAGSYQTILIVNAENGTPQGQIDLDYNVDDMEFTTDGSELIVFDGRNIHFINPETGAESRNFKGDDVEFYANAPYFTDISWMDKAIKVYSTKDGALVGSVKVEFSPLGAGFNSDFTELIVLSREHEISKEKSLINHTVEPIDGYNPFNSAYIKQQNDDEGSDFVVYNIPTMEEKLHTIIPYKTSNSFDLTISGHLGNYYLSCWDMLIRVDHTGKAFPIEPDDCSFTQTSSASSDGKYLVLASSEKGLLYDCSNQKLMSFDVSAEFMAPTTSDAVCTKDAVYMISEDYSIVTMNYLGQSTKRFQLSETSGPGFGVYYYNGNDEGEDRAAENTIINTTLDNVSQPHVDLNHTESGDYAQIAVFKTLQEALAFIEALDEAGLDYDTRYAPVKKG